MGPRVALGRRGQVSYPPETTISGSLSVQGLGHASQVTSHLATSAFRTTARNMMSKMPLFGGWLRKLIFSISIEEASFARRGFQGAEPGARQRLEQSGITFLTGYQAALEEDDPYALAGRLNATGAGLRGFAFEGAAMALTLLDHLTPWKRSRWLTFARGPGASHVYMVHVGAGWAFARLPWLRRHIERPLRRMDPLLRWLAIDGYGFHEGYFHWRKYVEGRTAPPHLSGYMCRVFDQGLGRSLWFVNGADVARIRGTIAAFPPARQSDLWSGVGLACAYAGGVDRAAVEALRTAAGSYTPQLAQGAAFAAKARRRADNPAPHTEFACEVLCGMSVETAAQLTDAVLDALPWDSEEPAYEVWRQRIQAQFAAAEVTR